MRKVNVKENYSENLRIVKVRGIRNRGRRMTREEEEEREDERK